MPAFNHSLMGLICICDTEFSVHFHKNTVTIYEPQVIPLLQVWRDNKGANLWRFSLCPQTSTPSATEEDIQASTLVSYTAGNSSGLQAFSAYDLPSVEALVG